MIKKNGGQILMPIMQTSLMELELIGNVLSAKIITNGFLEFLLLDHVSIAIKLWNIVHHVVMISLLVTVVINITF